MHSESDRSRPNSYSEIEDDVSVSIDFDHVFKFGIGDDADGSSKCVSKFQRETHATLTHQVEMIVLAQIGTQVERIQRIAVPVITASYKQPFVFAQSPGSSIETVECSYIQLMFVIRLYRSDGMLLLTVQVQCNLAQVEMVKIEWIAFGVSVECAIGYESDDCLLYTSPSPRDRTRSRMPSSA